MKKKNIIVVILVSIVLIAAISFWGSSNSLEKKFLAGHSWGETENQFYSKKTDKTIFGCDVYSTEGEFSSGLYSITHSLYPVDKSDYEKIAKEIASTCKESDEVRDSFYGYDGSIYYQINYVEEEIWWSDCVRYPHIRITIENDAEN